MKLEHSGQPWTMTFGLWTIVTSIIFILVACLAFVVCGGKEDEGSKISGQQKKSKQEAESPKQPSIDKKPEPKVALGSPVPKVVPKAAETSTFKSPEGLAVGKLVSVDSFSAKTDIVFNLADHPKEKTLSPKTSSVRQQTTDPSSKDASRKLVMQKLKKAPPGCPPRPGVNAITAASMAFVRK